MGDWITYDNGYSWFPSEHTPTAIEFAKMKCSAYFRRLNADERYWR